MTLIKLAHDEKTSKPQTAPVEAVSWTIPQQKPAEKTAPDLATATPKTDLAMWIKLFNTQPTEKLLTAFIAAYKSGQLSAQDYYSVMSALQKSTNKDVRKLSILGSSFEHNNSAFQILVHEKYSETVVDLQTLVNQSIQSYKNVQYLSFLVKPLTRGDVYVKIESSDLIGQIVQEFKTPTTLTADIKNVLNGYVSILTPLSKDGTSKQLQASAAQTLSYVRTILGLTT